MEHITIDNIILAGAVVTMLLFMVAMYHIIKFFFTKDYDLVSNETDKAIKDTNGYS